MAVHDPAAYQQILSVLRAANDGFSLTVWDKSADGEAGWTIWSTLDAKYAEGSPGWIMTIPCSDIVKALEGKSAL